MNCKHLNKQIANIVIKDFLYTEYCKDCKSYVDTDDRPEHKPFKGNPVRIDR